MSDFMLMHKDIPVLDCRFSDGYLIETGRVYEYEHIPVGCMNMLNRVDSNLIRAWWDSRLIPATRANVKAIQSSLRNVSLQSLSQVNFGCNLSDQYWIKPIGSDLQYRDVNFFENDFRSDLNGILLGADKADDVSDFFTASCSTGGDVPKAWIIHHGERVLYKSSGTAFGQEPYNEVIASQLNDELGINHVPYRLMQFKDVRCSVCPCMIDVDHEIVTAHEIVRANRPLGASASGDVGLYMQFVKSQRLDIRKSISNMAISDFLMRNTDRHWGNFGLIRNVNTLKYERIVPLFDYGNSLFHNSVHVDDKIVFSRFTGKNLADDLKYARDVDLQAVERFPEIVSSVLSVSDIPISRQEQLVGFAESRVRQLSEYFGGKRFERGRHRT